MQKTEVKKILESNIDWNTIKQAGYLLRTGGLVAFPTETVYGLGADALQPEASKKIYAAKGRPSDNPLIVHICKFEHLSKIVTCIPKAARLLADAFWPGPLTMILKKSDEVPIETTGGMDTVAVRMPSNKIALALIREGGGYIAAPSANTSGRPSPTMAEHVYEDLKNKIPLILDGGAVGIGIESTIIDLTEDIPVVLRPGYISLEMLASVIGDVRMDPGILSEDSDTKPKAPGMKYRHYAPKAEMIVVDGTQEKVVQKINMLSEEKFNEGKKVGIIGTEETVGCYKYGLIISIGKKKEEEIIAHNLYRILRELDESDVDIIFSESFSTPRMGQAIMNRLLKAAGHQVIVAE
ncbi:Threonylcarbamoyl-AMP synthase [Eubacterium plexicaudatum ASF492]|uniref:Threonylcarbamoyl-AMP synthase n=1 Tax=Eubacterium plexicaudatum ASF492 TaxID=1235802 RepID=N2B5I6_9FIRM|nr:Threonylcarbamoyl-AMP synthase [Eubacterium plexicaudatum ASF492]